MLITWVACIAALAAVAVATFAIQAKRGSRPQVRRQEPVTHAGAAAPASAEVHGNRLAPRI
jgi:hypothetical protein